MFYIQIGNVLHTNRICREKSVKPRPLENKPGLDSNPKLQEAVHRKVAMPLQPDLLAL